VLGKRFVCAKRRSFGSAVGELGDRSGDGRIENLVTTEAEAGAGYRGSDDGERENTGNGCRGEKREGKRKTEEYM